MHLALVFVFGASPSGTAINPVALFFSCLLTGTVTTPVVFFSSMAFCSQGDWIFIKDGLVEDYEVAAVIDGMLSTHMPRAAALTSRTRLFFFGIPPLLQFSSLGCVRMQTAPGRLLFPFSAPLPTRSPWPVGKRVDRLRGQGPSSPHAHLHFPRISLSRCDLVRAQLSTTMGRCLSDALATTPFKRLPTTLLHSRPWETRPSQVLYL